MSAGGARVPTPYFPGSSSLLLAVGMMAGGWDGNEGLHFPDEWEVEAERFAVAIAVVKNKSNYMLFDESYALVSSWMTKDHTWSCPRDLFGRLGLA